MPQTMEINASAELATWLRQLGAMYGKDLKALPESAYSACFAGCARTPQDFTAEVGGMNRYVATLLRGETPAQHSDEEKAARLASLSTRDAGIAEIIDSCNVLATAVEANQDRLGEMTKAPWDQPMTFYALANIAASHVMYHDGQITYLQSLLGDDKMHWFDE